MYSSQSKRTRVPSAHRTSSVRPGPVNSSTRNSNRSPDRLIPQLKSAPKVFIVFRPPDTEVELDLIPPLLRTFANNFEIGSAVIRSGGPFTPWGTGVSNSPPTFLIDKNKFPI